MIRANQSNTCIFAVLALVFSPWASEAQDMLVSPPNNFRTIVNAPGSYQTNPTIVLADPGAATHTGLVPVYQGNAQSGGGYITHSRIDTEEPAFFNFLNLGSPNGQPLPNGSGSMDVQIWSLQHSTPQAQGSLNFITATGDTPDNIAADGAGTQLGEIAFFGSSTHGIVQTETASLWAYLDQDCVDTSSTVPLEGNTRCGTNLLFRTTPNGQGSQNTVALFGQDGALWLGTWPDHALPSPYPAVEHANAGAGAIILRDSYAPLQSVPGATVLMSTGGSLYVRLANGGGLQPIAIINGALTPGHHLCAQTQSMIGDCGS